VRFYSGNCGSKAFEAMQILILFLKDSSEINKRHCQKTDGRFLRILSSNAEFVSSEERHRYGQIYALGYYAPNYNYYPTTQT
jgi:hypothetical protein